MKHYLTFHLLSLMSFYSKSIISASSNKEAVLKYLLSCLFILYYSFDLIRKKEQTINDLLDNWLVNLR